MQSTREGFSSEHQAKFGKFSARFLSVSVQDGMEAQARGDVAQERAIFYVGDLLGLYMRDVHSQAVDVEVGFADVHECGDDEESRRTP